jgi:hypothetical protein
VPPTASPPWSERASRERDAAARAEIARPGSFKATSGAGPYPSLSIPNNLARFDVNFDVNQENLIVGRTGIDSERIL